MSEAGSGLGQMPVTDFDRPQQINRSRDITQTSQQRVVDPVVAIEDPNLPIAFLYTEKNIPCARTIGSN